MYIMDDVLDLMDSMGDTLEKGKRGAKRVLRGEGGYSTFVIVLVILALGAIIITPLLAFVVTGQRAGRTHNEVTDRLYAADTGIQDGVWRVQNDDLPVDMLGSWTDPDVYDYRYKYWLPNQVNGCDVSVTLQAVWLLAGLESDKNGTMPHGELVTLSNVMGNGKYKIVIMDNGINGNYKLDRIGVWLPGGFTYIEGSSNVEKLDHNDPAYINPENVIVSEWKNGHTVIWDYDAVGMVEYTDLPAETPTRRVITFDFGPGGVMANAFSWCRTNRNDIYLSWSGDIKQFQLESTATDAETGRSTTVIAANMKNEGVASGIAINGDYVATGNAIVRDHDDDTYAFKERLYQKSPGEVSGVPDSGTARQIRLYWTGWKAYPLNAWYEDEVWGEWTDEDALDELENLVPNYKVNKVSLTVEIDNIYYPISGSVMADSWQVVPATKSNESDHPYEPWDHGNGWFYSCYADVTDLVIDTLRDVHGYDISQFNGNATYWIGHAEESESLVIDDILQGIWGNSATDIYVVGDSGTIMRYSDTGWDTVAVGATDEDLKDVWCFPTGEVWTVGDSYRIGGTNYYTILHSTDNGTSWEDGDGGITGGVDLKGIWASLASNVFAVGSSGRILRYNGSTWTVQTTPRTEILRGVWGSSDTDVWAVGDRYGSSTYYYTLLHTTNGGTNWNNYSMTGGQNLNGIWGADASHIWAVGARGTILYYNGTSWSSGPWTRPSGPGWDYTDVTLYGVWGTGGTDWAGGDRVYAVGYNSDTRQGVIWEYRGGSTWYNINSGTTRPLYGAWGSAADSIYAVGEATTGGTLIYYDGVDDNGDGSLWDPVTGGTKMYGWIDGHSSETPVASTDYPLGDPGTSFGDSTHPNYQVGHAAWSIVVIYTSPETKGHQLYLYETLEPSGRFNTKEFLIEGFLAPQSVLTEDDAAKITCFVGEGDERIYADHQWQLDGDDIYLNGDRLNNDANGDPSPINDVWNARSSEMDADGVDIDTFYIEGGSGTIQPGDTEATVEFETEEDVWNMVYMILSLRSDLSGTGLLSYIVK